MAGTGLGKLSKVLLPHETALLVAGELRDRSVSHYYVVTRNRARLREMQPAMSEWTAIACFVLPTSMHRPSCNNDDSSDGIRSTKQVPQGRHVGVAVCTVAGMYHIAHPLVRICGWFDLLLLLLLLHVCAAIHRVVFVM